MTDRENRDTALLIHWVYISRYWIVFDDDGMCKGLLSDLGFRNMGEEF